MDLTELLAVATDCASGEITRELVFEQSGADYDDFDKMVDFTDFEMWHLDGAKVEMMSAGKDGFEIYLSRVTGDGLKCYYVDYKPEGTKIFEVRPAKGELSDD